MITTTPHRRRTVHLAFLVALAAAAGLPAASGAATYQLEQCTSAHPEVNGWEPSYGGNWVYYGNGCSSGGTLSAYFDAARAHNSGDVVQWVFSAPQNTTVASVSAERRFFRSGTPNPGGFGDSHAQLITGSQVAETCTQAYGCTTLDGSAGWDSGGVSSVSFRVLCTGQNGCPASAVNAELRGIRVTLSDEFAPSITGLSGSLMSTQTTTRTRSLTLAATDQGSGVYRRRLVIDDQLQPAAVVDANNGNCASPFTARVPCKLSASESLSFDTNTLTDGAHDLAVRVTDATDANQAQSATWTIKVDNKPPSYNGPTVSGTSAQVGEPLTCSTGPVDGQSPTTTYQWVRANPDGSGPSDIPAATASTYTPSGADVGKKVMCRTAVSDGGGTTTKISSTTSGPFANGATVQPAPEAAPDPGTTPASETCPSTPTGPGSQASQDLDGDGVPNCRDTDDDGDGIPDTEDPAPLERADPNPPAPTAAPDASAVTAPTAGSSSTVTTTLLRLGKDTTTKLSRRATWKRSAFTLRGRLADAGGAPVADLPLQVTQTVAGRVIRLAAARTTSTGAWSVRVPRGPSRTITVKATDGTNTATVIVRQTVRAHLTLRADRGMVGRAGRVLFRGRLYGGYTNSREKLVEFQIHYRGAWRTIRTLKVNRAGRFAVSYRFGSRAYGTYRFRARTLPTDAYPFTTAASGTARSTVTVR